MTLVFRQLFDAVSSTYTYLLGDDESAEAVVIDPVFELHARDLSLAQELDLRITHVIETHVHADHVTGAWLLRDATGAEIVISRRSGADGADRYLEHGDVISFGTHRLEARETPGHTGGCMTFVLDDGRMAFTGDCLLIRGAGRTDFQEGDAHQMFHSIREQIFSLPSNCAIYPAHDYSGRTSSCVSEERKHNPRVGGTRNRNDFVGFMENLGLPHPKKLDVAVPANLQVGRPADGVRPVAAPWGPVRVTYAGVPEVPAKWAREHRGEIHLLDVRSAEERLETPLEGSIHIPIDELVRRVEEVPADKPVITVCRSGARSAQAITLLKRQGRTTLANLSGGMLEWLAADG
ncbi:MAG: MBL fold metallo-hydrolase [Myxococcota bacterium]